MTTPEHADRLWARLPTMLRAVVTGLLLTAVAANVWPILLRNLGVPLAVILEVIFLALFLWWARGGGPPRATQGSRAKAFRRVNLTSKQWIWGLIAAFFFAASVHASIVLLFRFIPYPAAAFRHGYDLSFVPSQALRWVAVVISAASAAICEETGIRGFMQQPIEQRHGVLVAVLISSLFFMALHLNQAWARSGIVPIVFGAGLMLGILAWSSGSLVPGIIGHFVMDVGLFAYWWTGIAGDFIARPISETGLDQPFLVACCAFAGSLTIALFAISRLGRAL